MRDTGTGLPAETGDAPFTPFVTTRAHGLGIGLSIARTILGAHGGSINACNHPRGGATFTVTLPRSDPPAVLPGPADCLHDTPGGVGWNSVYLLDASFRRASLEVSDCPCGRVCC